MKKAQVKSKKNQEITKTNQTFSWFLGALIKKSRPPNVDLKVLKDRKIRFKFRFLIPDQRRVKKKKVLLTHVIMKKKWWGVNTWAPPLFFPSPFPTKQLLKILSLHFSLLNFPSSLKSLQTNIPLKRRNSYFAIVPTIIARATQKNIHSPPPSFHFLFSLCFQMH